MMNWRAPRTLIAAGAAMLLGYLVWSATPTEQRCVAVLDSWVEQCLVDGRPATLRGFDLAEISRRSTQDPVRVTQLLSDGCILTGKGRQPADRQYEVTATRCGEEWLACVTAKRGTPITYAFECNGRSIVGEFVLTQLGRGDPNPPDANPSICAQCLWPK